MIMGHGGKVQWLENKNIFLKEERERGHPVKRTSCEADG